MVPQTDVMPRAVRLGEAADGKHFALGTAHLDGLQIGGLQMGLAEAAVTVTDGGRATGRVFHGTREQWATPLRRVTAGYRCVHGVSP